MAKKMSKLLLISLSLLMLPACTRIAHISDSGEIVVDRPDLYSATAQAHEEGHLQGLYHCPDNKCYMFFMDLGRLELCSKCEAKKRTTTYNWLSRRIL